MGSPVANVSYSTVWGASAPATASQVVQIVDAAGGVVRTDSFDRAGKSSSSLNILAVSPGVYELRATNYARAGAQGAKLGTASVVVDLCGTGRASQTAVQTTSADPPTRVAVQPKSATLREQTTKRFVATAVGSSGVPCFTPSLSWTVLGGVGTIDGAGLFTGTTAGAGSIRATVGDGVSATASVTVQPFVIKQGKWTVLVYMNAANDLYPYSDLNMNQMEQVAVNDDVRFVVQWKQSRSAFPGSTFDGVRRYLVRPGLDPNLIESELVQDKLVDVQGDNLDMGQAQTLNDFIAWGKQFYPADRYVLVVWNHGNGWQRRPERDRTRAFSYDDQYGTSIQIWQMGQALAGQHFDVIAWDASLMQMAEVAYEARGHADFIVGSEESPPAEGYPYHLVFAPFVDNPSAPARTLTKGFVDGMVTDPRYLGRKITQSVLETSKLPAVASAVDSLAEALILNRAAVAAAVTTSRQQSQSYSPTSLRTYRDLVDVCQRLKAAGVPSDVGQAATAVESAVKGAVVWEGHNSQSSHSNGLAIDFSRAADFVGLRSEYIRLKFAQDTRWDEWLAVAP
ncbi:MAG: hypothetical protein KIT11_10965 [Fimbriimonadaceae bacterium]|nr:hypothetical protein [Fimbriimonadaceae bacterium]QYK55841.1 MAG: hypothetical protein KF733_12635 [Fimbriimonadaceae bacterium]